MASEPAPRPTSSDAPPAIQDNPARGEAKDCPSATCQEGALLLGVMTGSGRLAYVQPPTRVDAEFVARAKARGHPERTFRFSSPCIEGACPQWTGDHCGLGEVLAKQVDVIPPPTSAGLPTCAIRSSCRWYSEQGRDACAVCPLVVADTGGTETYRSLLPASAVAGAKDRQSPQGDSVRGPRDP